MTAYFRAKLSISSLLSLITISALITLVYRITIHSDSLKVANDDLRQKNELANAHLLELLKSDQTIIGSKIENHLDLLELATFRRTAKSYLNIGNGVRSLVAPALSELDRVDYTVSSVEFYGRDMPFEPRDDDYILYFALRSPSNILEGNYFRVGFEVYFREDRVYAIFEYFTVRPS